jgi:hypothetical protein
MPFPPTPDPANFGLLRRLGELIEVYAGKPLAEISSSEFNEIRYQIAMVRVHDSGEKMNCTTISRQLGVSHQAVWTRKHCVRAAPRDD